jgi:hypothetical protein
MKENETQSYLCGGFVRMHRRFLPAVGIAYFSIYPVGFYITTFAVGLYLIARLIRVRSNR